MPNPQPEQEINRPVSYPDNYYLSFPDTSLSEKLLNFYFYSEEKIWTEERLNTQIAKKIYQLPEGIYPHYYKDSHSEFNAYSNTETGRAAIAEIRQELTQCFTYLEDWANKYELEVIRTVPSEEINEQGEKKLSLKRKKETVKSELDYFIKKLLQNGFPEKMSLFYADGKRAIETIALLVCHDNDDDIKDIDLEFRQNQLIELTTDGNLRMCAEGCFSRFSEIAETLKNYGEFGLLSLIKTSLIFLARKVVRNRFRANHHYLEFLCRVVGISPIGNEIHAHNYLINKLLVELKLESLMIQDDRVSIFENVQNPIKHQYIKDIYQQFNENFKAEFNVNYLIKFIAEQFYQKENIHFPTEGVSTPLELEVVNNFLTVLGDDLEFNSHEILDYDEVTKKIVLKDRTALFITIVERLINKGWINFNRLLQRYDALRPYFNQDYEMIPSIPRLDKLTSSDYRIFPGDIRFTWLKIEEERIPLLSFLKSGKDSVLSSVKALFPGESLGSLLDHSEDLTLFFKNLPSIDHEEALSWMQANGLDFPTIMLNKFLYTQKIMQSRFLHGRGSFLLIKDFNKLFSNLAALPKFLELVNTKGLIRKLLKENAERIRDLGRGDFPITFNKFIRHILKGGFRDFNHLVFEKKPEAASGSGELYLKDIDFSNADLEKTIFNDPMNNCVFSDGIFKDLKFNLPINTIKFKNSRLERLGIYTDALNVDFSDASGDILLNGNFKSIEFIRSSLKIQINGVLDGSDLSDSTSQVIMNGDIQNSKADNFKGELKINGKLSKLILTRGDRTLTQLTVDGNVHACQLRDMKFKQITINGEISDSYFTATDFRETRFIEKMSATISQEKSIFCGQFRFDLEKMDGSQAFFSHSQFSTASLTEFLRHPAMQAFVKSQQVFPLLMATNLHEVDFQDSMLQRALKRFSTLYFDETNLQSVDFSGFNFKKVSFKKANLQNVNFNRANLKAADLRNCDLSTAHLEEANVAAAKIDGLQLCSKQLFQFYEQNHRDFSKVRLVGLLEEGFSERLLTGAKLSPQIFEHLIAQGFKNFQAVDLTTIPHELVMQHSIRDDLFFDQALLSRASDLITLCSETGETSSRKKREIPCLEQKEIEEVMEIYAGEWTGNIHSQRFLSAMRKLPEEKRVQLIRYISNKPILGPNESEVKQLIHQERIQAHFTRLTRISNAITHGLITKNIVRDFLSGNYQGLAVNFGFIGGEHLLGKLSEASFANGEKWLLVARKQWLGRFLKMAAPFLERGSMLFIIFSMKELRINDPDGLVDFISNTAYLSTEFLQFYAGVMRAVGLYTGAAINTVGMTVGTLLFLGTDIYKAVKKVERMNVALRLTGGEKTLEGIRSFLGMNPQAYLQELIDKKQVINQLVQQALMFLNRHPFLQAYVFPTGTMVQDCPKYPLTSKLMLHKACDIFLKIISFGRDKGRTCDEEVSIEASDPQCNRQHYQTDLNNVVLLDKKRANKRVYFRESQTPIIRRNRFNIGYKAKSTINWGRLKPDNAFCFPRGEEQATEFLYTCKKALGIEVSSKTGNYTLIEVGEGHDRVTGFLERPNIISASNGYKTLEGGKKDDLFILLGDVVVGTIDGKRGTNTLDVSNFAVAANGLQIDFNKGYLKHNYYTQQTLQLSHLQQILARKNLPDRITVACDTIYVDGNAGKNQSHPDIIHIPANSCFYDLQLILHANTQIVNQALRGNVSYLVMLQEEEGEALIDLDPHNSELRHNFFFNYTLNDVDGIEVKPVNNRSQVLTLRFLAENRSNNGFNVSIPSSTQNTYTLADQIEIKIAEQNVQILQKSQQIVSNFIQNYIVLARKLHAFITVQGKDESLIIGNRHPNIMANDPEARKSHLIGNGGENVYVISAQEKIYLQVILYRYYSTNFMQDTLDLRSLAQQYQNLTGERPQLRVHDNSQSNILDEYDLLLVLQAKYPLGMNQGPDLPPFCQVILKNARVSRWNWYRELKVIYDRAPLRIEQHALHHWRMIPELLQFDHTVKNIFISPEDVDMNTRVLVERNMGPLSFLRDGVRNGEDLADLVITNINPQVREEDFCTVVLKRFYQDVKLSTLTIEFMDQTIELRKKRRHLEQILTLSEWLKQTERAVYQTVLGETVEKSSLLIHPQIGEGNPLRMNNTHPVPLVRDTRSTVWFSTPVRVVAVGSVLSGLIAVSYLFFVKPFLGRRRLSPIQDAAAVVIPLMAQQVVQQAEAIQSDAKALIACFKPVFKNDECTKSQLERGEVGSCANGDTKVAWFKEKESDSLSYVISDRVNSDASSGRLFFKGDDLYFIHSDQCQQHIPLEGINSAFLPVLAQDYLVQQLLTLVEQQRLRKQQEYEVAVEQFKQGAKVIACSYLGEQVLVHSHLGDYFRVIGLRLNWQQRDVSHWSSRMLKFSFNYNVLSIGSISGVCLETALLHPFVQLTLLRNTYRGKLVIRFIADLLQFGVSVSTCTPALIEFLCYQHAWSHEIAVGLRGSLALLEVINDPSSWYLAVCLFILPQIPYLLENLGIPVTRCISHTLEMLKRFLLPYSLLLSVQEDPERLKIKAIDLEAADQRVSKGQERIVSVYNLGVGFFSKAKISEEKTNDTEFSHGASFSERTRKYCK